MTSGPGARPPPRTSRTRSHRHASTARSRTCDWSRSYATRSTPPSPRTRCTCSGGSETRSFADAVAAELGSGSAGSCAPTTSGRDGTANSSAATSRGSTAISSALYLYEDFGADPHGVLRDLYGFLGVDETFTPDLTVRRNVTRVPSRLDRLPAPLRRARALVPASVRSRLRTRTVVTLELTDATRSVLLEHYRADVLETAATLVDRDLSSWITPSERRDPTAPCCGSRRPRCRGARARRTRPPSRRRASASRMPSASVELVERARPDDRRGDPRLVLAPQQRELRRVSPALGGELRQPARRPRLPGR